MSQCSLVPQSAATCPGNKSFFTISNAGSQLARCEFGRHLSANQSRTLLLPTCYRAPASIPRPTVSCQATCEVVHFPQGEAFPSFLLPVECGTKQKTLTPLVQPSEKPLPLLYPSLVLIRFVGCLGPALEEADGILKADAYHGERNRLMSLLR